MPILLFSTERREESAGLKFYVVICTDAFIFFIELLGDFPVLFEDACDLFSALLQLPSIQGCPCVVSQLSQGGKVATGLA